jgi:hypothetical protein
VRMAWRAPFLIVQRVLNEASFSQDVSSEQWSQ